MSHNDRYFETLGWKVAADKTVTLPIYLAKSDTGHSFQGDYSFAKWFKTECAKWGLRAIFRAPTGQLVIRTASKPDSREG
jgi:hypothetical protein